MIRSAAAWAISGLTIGLLVGGADALTLALTARPMFFETRELVRTMGWTLGICTGAGVASFVALGIFIDAARAIFFRTESWGRHPRLSFVVAVALASPLFFIFWQLTSGPQASQLPGRHVIVFVAATFAALFGGVIIVRVPTWAAANQTRRGIVFMTTLVVSACLWFIDLTVLVRLYPVFHGALTASVLAVGGAGIRIWIGTPRRLVVVLLGISLSLGAIAWGAWSLSSLRDTQNPRFVASERTASTSNLLSLAHSIWPPPAEKSLDAAPTELENTLPSTYGATYTVPGAHVFLLTVDAMRYDRLSLLGAKRSVAPHLDALAKSSVVFSRAYTPIPHTSYAISSLLTGKYTRPLFAVPGAPEAHETWPEILHRFRYKTAAFFTRAVFFIDRAKFEPYIRTSFGFSVRQVDYKVPAQERADQFLAYLEEMREDQHPLFAWVHFFDPHEPYNPDCTHFGDRPVDKYDCEIWKVDQELGRILDFIDEAYPNSIVIVSSDHGEEFGDHGGRFHGTTLYDEQVRVPLIIRAPGIEHRVVDEPVNLVDLLGTTLTLLDIPIPARVRSRDLSGLLMGKDSPREAFSEAHKETMVATRKHKLICNTTADLCRLYDMETDRGETRSIAENNPALTAMLKSRLLAWQRSHARIELRPVETAHGRSGWPPAIQQALTGDESAVPDLIALIQRETRLEVKRKAAELLRALWNAPSLDSLDALAGEDDPEVATWLAVLRVEAGDKDAINTLVAAQQKVERLSSAWRAAAVACLDEGSENAISKVGEVATFEQAPIEQRRQAVHLLGRSGKRSTVPLLIPLIDNYQLTLETAAALGRLADERAVGPLTKRLKRERFTERKTAIISALAAIGDRRAGRPIASELLAKSSPAEALGALVTLGLASPQGRVLTFDDVDVTMELYSELKSTSLSPRIRKPLKIVIQVSAQRDGGSLYVDCGDKVAGEMPLVTGKQEVALPLLNCDGSKDTPLNLTFRIKPQGLDASVVAAALIGN